MANTKKKIRPVSQSSIVNLKSSIYILHGWTYTLDKWANFARELESKRFEIKLLKIPGLTEKINRPWTIDDCVNWLYKKLEKEKDVVLIGHSNGGRIAMAFSIKHSDKVSKLILVDSAGIYHDELYIKVKRRIFGAIAKTGRKLARVGIARDFLYFLTREGDYKNATPNMKKTMVNLIESDKAPKIDRISVPTIIIWGQDDRVTPVSDGKILNVKIKNSRLFLIKGARHSPQFTHSEQLTEIILKNL